MEENRVGTFSSKRSHHVNDFLFQALVLTALEEAHEADQVSLFKD